jgi:hypothetical protein
LLVALCELAINRVAIGSRTVPGLVTMRLRTGVAPPDWYRHLSYAGLFLFYFAGTLAVAILAGRVVAAVRGGIRDKLAAVGLAVAGVLAGLPLVVAEDSGLTFALELAFAAAVVLLAVAAMARKRDPGVQIGIWVIVAPMLVHTIGVIGAKTLWPVAAAVVLLAVAAIARKRDLRVQIGLWVIVAPMLVHTVGVFGAKTLWPDAAFDMPGILIGRIGVVSLCVGALASPYLFAPRPFARAVTRPAPILITVTVAAIGAIAARTWYPTIAKGATLALGVELSQGTTDPRMAVYLLAIATLAWTLASCAIAQSAARRQIGVGIALVVLGGYAFRWPHHYLLPLVGIAFVADAARRVRDEELDALPIATDTPPIADGPWSSYVAAVKLGFERSLVGVHMLTTRGEGGLTSSLIVGDYKGLPVRARIERIEGSVIALDVVIGREIDEVRAATLTIWAIPPRKLGRNPAGPPAAPLFKSGDPQFDERFKCRGNALVLSRLFDDGLRARVAATLDGWLAYWDGEGLRYRVYPGRGAPLDHPIPVSDLALGRNPAPDRLVAVIDLLVEIAERGVKPASDAEPRNLS